MVSQPIKSNFLRVFGKKKKKNWPKFPICLEERIKTKPSALFLPKGNKNRLLSVYYCQIQ